MIGFNSRETHQDAIFDIQSQEPTGERVLETRIYRNGKILATVRRAFREGEPTPAVYEKLSVQHEEICKKVRDGNYALIFLWISRGIIFYEAQEYLKALECFESVLAIDEDNREVEEYLDGIRDRLREEPGLGPSLAKDLQDQVEELIQTGRQTDAERRKVFLLRLRLTAPDPPVKERRLPANPPRSFFSRLRFRFAGPAARLGRKRTESKRSPSSSLRLRPRWPVIHLSGNLLAIAASMLLLLCAGFLHADSEPRLPAGYCTRQANEYLKVNRVLPARTFFYQRVLQEAMSQEALLDFWNTFHLLGDYPAAVDSLVELTRAERHSSRVLFCLGEAYRLSSRCDEAIPCYRSALDQGAPETDVKIGWGLCLLQKNRTEEAIGLWEDLLKADSRDYRIDYCLGQAYQQSGRPGRASICFSQALNKNPESFLVCRALADCLEGLHQTQQARMLRDKADSILERTGQSRGSFPEGTGPMSRVPDASGTSSPQAFSPVHPF
jgi:tetratricopeptide (TPR) repeat protein